MVNWTNGPHLTECLRLELRLRRRFCLYNLTIVGRGLICVHIILIQNRVRLHKITV